MINDISINNSIVCSNNMTRRLDNFTKQYCGVTAAAWDILYNPHQKKEKYQKVVISHWTPETDCNYIVHKFRKVLEIKDEGTYDPQIGELKIYYIEVKNQKIYFKVNTFIKEKLAVIERYNDLTLKEGITWESLGEWKVISSPCNQQDAQNLANRMFELKVPTSILCVEENTVKKFRVKIDKDYFDYSFFYKHLVERIMNFAKIYNLSINEIQFKFPLDDH